MSEPFLHPQWYRVASLRPRLRAHVSVRRHRYRGSSWYVMQDDVTGLHHRFTPTVYLLIGLMDGRRMVRDIWEQVVSQIGDEAPTQGEVIRLLSNLHAADILQADIPPATTDLLRRHESHSRSQIVKNFGNPLSLRLPLADPDRFLNRTLWLVQPLLGRVGAVIWLAVVLPALVLLAVHWPELSDNVTERVLTAENLFLVALIYPCVKACHELGHAFSIKASGGEVHDVGLLFITLMPVPYVDVSASSALRSKWRRAFIAGAGMLVEVFIAAIAMIVWTLVEPGAVRTVAFNTMLIAGVSTLVFNGNPLLRFDGYFILCDLLELPNLAARANRFWTQLVERHAFGIEQDAAPATPGERFWFILYAPLSLAYRLLVTFSLALFVAGKFFVIGVILAIWGFSLNFLWPAVKALGFLLTSPRLQARRGRALSASVLIAGLLAAGLFVMPFPLHTVAEGVVWLPDDSIVRAQGDGLITAFATSPGEQVNVGQRLIVSEDPAVLVNMRVLQSQIDGLRARFVSLAFTDQVQADLTQQELTLKSAALTRERQKSEQLVIESPSQGLFVVPHASDLPGRFAHRGDVLGYVTPLQSRIIRVIVDQADIDLVRQRLRSVQVKIVGQPDRTYPGVVLREVPAASDYLPSKALSDAGGGKLAADPRDKNQTKTLQKTFQFDVQLPPAAEVGEFGARALVRFDHGSEAIGLQWGRRLRQLFLAHLDV